MNLSAVVSVACNGVYPRAVFTSAEDREKVAVRLDRPCLVKVRVLCAETGVEKVIPVT